MKYIVSLCDITGVMVKPWIDAGYGAVLVDPQHGVDSVEGPVVKIASTVQEALPALSCYIGNIAFVSAFPPCTDLASSGARWWVSKREADFMFQAKAVAVAEQCRTFGILSGAPWFVENPTGALSRVFGESNHMFHPWHYNAICAGDNYTKGTRLWSGGGFVMPPKQVNPELGAPDNRIHFAPDSKGRDDFRSATPLGFAKAVFAANASA